MKQRFEQRHDMVQSQEMRQRLLGELIQRADLLQTTLPELEARIEELEDTSILLREEEPSDAPEAPDADSEGDGEALPEDFPSPDAFEAEEFTRFREDSYGVRDPDEDPKADFLQNQPGGGETLQEHLLSQIEETDAPRRIKELAARLASSLDPNGYLVASFSPSSGKARPAPPSPPLTGFPEEPLDEVFSPTPEEMEESGYVPPAPEERLRALELLQSLDPPGVAARSRQECLLLQAREMDDLDPRVVVIIRDHLEDLVNNRLPRIADSLGISMEELKELLKEFHRFDLFPGRDFYREPAVYVRPEIVIRPQGEDYSIEILGGSGNLRLNKNLRRLVRQADGETRTFFERKFQEAKRLLDHLEQRRHTLEGIARVIVDEQRPFLEYGEAYLKPLEMQEVARRLGLDVSTISRAVSGKYVDTPMGVYPLRMFFSSGFRRSGPSADGQPEALSRVAVKNMIKEIVDSEDKSKPLSDEEIAKELAKRGINIKRRTVNKYRAELGIPSKEKRAQY